jgi:hypothetical protein
MNTTQEHPYHSVYAISVLYGLAQILDFYLAYHYYGKSDIIAFDIYTSFWFLINGVIGIQYSLFFTLYYLLRNVESYRTEFIFTYALLLTLAMGWTTIGFIGFFNNKIPFYFLIKLALQILIYGCTIGVYCN